ncbi:MAG TPA: 3,4-dihydroxy-2-butanone-4-phosphate synthase [Steroidobacteraceae bacterium]|nr:3,4-dihydroxy-2-butanone-4-phosphate synthase [Steroidobacteraceae bacterium]
MNSIEEIVAEVRNGRMVVIMDDETRENEADLIMAAETATPEAIAFFVRYTSGIICQPMLRERLQELRLPQMVPENTESHRTAFTISVDFRQGTTTGISAHDRAKTIRALADPGAQPDDFARPGHIFPLRYTEGGVLCRAGHTEATVDLVRLAGFRSHTGILCEIVNDDGTMKRGPQLLEFAGAHNLKVGTIADLIRYRLKKERSVERISDQAVETEFGPFRMFCYEDHVNRDVHIALVRGDLDGKSPPLVRVHLTDTLRDVIGIRGDRGWPLRDALRRIAEEGSGVVVILRQAETPRDLVEALRTIDASKAGGARHEGSRVLRTYGIGAQILQDLGVTRMRVLSAPRQMVAISAFDLEITEYVDSES